MARDALRARYEVRATLVASNNSSAVVLESPPSVGLRAVLTPVLIGEDGANGKSAYQVAVDEGFVGNEAAWLASLVGADGSPDTASNGLTKTGNNIALGGPLIEDTLIDLAGYLLRLSNGYFEILDGRDIHLEAASPDKLEDGRTTDTLRISGQLLPQLKRVYEDSDSVGTVVASVYLEADEDGARITLAGAVTADNFSGNSSGNNSGDAASDPVGTSAATLATHVAAGDPHPGYVLESTLGVTTATLIAGTVPTSQIPALAISEFLGSVAGQSAMLALIGQQGDWAIRTDLSKVAIISGNDPTQLSNWTLLVYPTAPVTSVNGQAGAVVLGYGDVGADVAGAAASAQAAAVQRSNHTGTQLAATISDFAATVRTTVLTGLSLVTNQAVAATDTVLQAFGYLQKQVTDLIATVTAGDAASVATAAADATAKADAKVIDSIADADTTHAPSRNAVFDALALKVDTSDARLTDARTPVGTALTSAYLWVGNGSNAAAAVLLSGDFTITNTGVGAIGSGKVTLAMQANMATDSVVYRKTAGSGAPEVNTLATLKADLGLTGTNSGDQTITLTGDVTGSGTGSFAATLATAQPAAHTWALTQTFTVAPTFTAGVGTIGAGTWNGTIIATAYGGTGVDNSTGGTANQFWARPNGATGAATYRAIVAADIPTLNQSTTGSAATLTTPRAIYGNNFDGSAALAQIIASTYGGTGNGFTKFSGPMTSERTKTLRDASDTILELGGNYTPTGTWTSLTMVTPVLGTPASGNLANCTFPTLNQNTSGSSASCTGNAATVTTNANLTGHVTSTGNATVLGSFTIAQLNTAVSDADVVVITASNNYTAVATPSAPSSGFLAEYTKTLCGREMGFVRGPSGIERCLDVPEITGWHGTFRGGGVAAGVFSGFQGATGGTAALVTPTITNRYTLMSRSSFSSIVTTQNQQIGFRGAVNHLFRGNAAGLGGFLVVVRFGFQSIKAGMRLFVGVTTNTLTVDADPSSKLNIAGFGVDIGDTAISFMHNDGSGTATKDAIAGQATLATNNTGFIAVIHAYPNDTKISYALYDLVQGVWLCDTSTSTDLPVNTTGLNVTVAMSNGTANIVLNDAVIGISTGDIYTEN